MLLTEKLLPNSRQGIPTITQDEDQEPINVAQERGQRSRRIAIGLSTKSPLSIFSQALYTYLGSATFDTPEWSIPHKLANKELPTSPKINIEEYTNGVVHSVTKETIKKYKTLIEDPILKDKQKKTMCVELVRLAQGYEDIAGTDTIKFMTHEEIKNIPSDRNRTVTYARIVVDYRAHKDDPYRVRITIGGNLIECSGELTTRTADLTTTQVTWNSIISTRNARYMCADVKNFYLCTPLERYEYTRMPINLIPQEFIDLYDLGSKVKNEYVCIEIQKGMYGLPRTGILANQLLKQQLLQNDYFEVPHTPGLFRPKTRPVWFTLVVDGFGIKYMGK